MKKLGKIKIVLSKYIKVSDLHPSASLVKKKKSSYKK